MEGKKVKRKQNQQPPRNSTTENPHLFLVLSPMRLTALGPPNNP